RTMYSTLFPAMVFGHIAMVFFSGIPSDAAGPVAEMVTPILICPCAPDASAMSAPATSARVMIRAMFSPPCIRVRAGYDNGWGREQAFPVLSCILARISALRVWGRGKDRTCCEDFGTLLGYAARRGRRARTGVVDRRRRSREGPARRVPRHRYARSSAVQRQSVIR